MYNAIFNQAQLKAFENYKQNENPQIFTGIFTPLQKHVISVIYDREGASVPKYANLAFTQAQIKALKAIFAPPPVPPTPPVELTPFVVGGTYKGIACDIEKCEELFSGAPISDAYSYSIGLENGAFMIIFYRPLMTNQATGNDENCNFIGVTAIEGESIVNIPIYCEKVGVWSWDSYAFSPTEIGQSGWQISGNSLEITAFINGGAISQLQTDGTPEEYFAGWAE